MTNPTWWKQEHESRWDRVKDALKKDWEQTKNDVSSKKGADLGQTAGKTLKEMWSDVEPGYRYGVGARAKHDKWDEQALRDEWTSLKDGRKWEDVAPHVKRGYEWDV